MDRIERRLADERRLTLDRLKRLTNDFDDVVTASRDANADDEHDPEGATIAFERSQLDALIQQAEQRVTEIDAAAERLRTSTYGVCETCGGPIGEQRLDARPTARTCIRCAARPTR